MKVRSIRSGVVGAFALAATTALVSAGAAGAAPLPDVPFGGWDRCPIENPDASTCLDITVKGGTMKIGKLAVDVPMGAMQIAGAVAFVPDENAEFGFRQVFIPPTDGSQGLYSEPIDIPGGALGIDLPFDNLFGLNKASATVEPAGAPGIDAFQFNVSMPVKLKISNPLLGNKCYLGSDNKPVTLDLAVTTSDQLTEVPGYPDTAVNRNAQHEAAPFAVPGASGCGPFGILNPIVNWRASTPSPEGKNSLTTTSDVFNIGADSLRSQP